MASLPSLRKRRIRLLDPGAGAGMLTAAICERLFTLRAPREIELVAYETDPGVIPHLERTLSACKTGLEQNGHRASFEIRVEDFAGCRPSQEPMFDVVMMNPPYAKTVTQGCPNLYAVFMAQGARGLCPGGQLVSITPRSFCSGRYFRGFRQWFFGAMRMDHVHLFESRTEAFRGERVLQESVILCATQCAKPRDSVIVTTSQGTHIEPNRRAVAYATVLSPDDRDCLVHIPETPDDEALLRLVRSWPNRFASLGLKISTGPVVLFRCREHLLFEQNGQAHVPLLSSHNIRPFETRWPVQKRNKPVAFANHDASQRHLVPAANYVLLKRFTAKEECRRLVASCLSPADFSCTSFALENHINYIHRPTGGLTEAEMYGLAALFNSSLMDRYFRTFSGTTQVNASEVRTMRMPAWESICALGSRLLRRQKLDPGAAESMVMGQFSVDDRLREHLGRVTR